MVVVKVSGEIRAEGHPTQFFDEALTLTDTAKELHMSRDRVADVVGDGKNKVAVSMELKDKDMGNGFGAFVTVSLACDSTEEAVEEAADLATELTAVFVADAFDVAAKTYRKASRR